MSGPRADGADPWNGPVPGRETLDDLAQEAAALAPGAPAAGGEGQGEAAQDAAQGEIVPPVTEGLRLACRTIAGVLGAIACDRAGVEPLRDVEREQLGDALAGVAVFYLPADGDPRVMAWLTLGLAVAGVAAPRIKATGDAGPARVA
jgi:hypothetical protein